VDDRGVFDGKSSCLAAMMALGDGDEGLWTPEELAAMLKHQLSAPLDFDISYLSEQARERLRVLLPAQGPPIRSFSDLLHHPCPPVELLAMTKEFAKACRTRRERLLPEEIAAMLYTLSIVVARTKCGERLTKLDDHTLRYGLDWALKQSWVDEPTRGLLREGRRVIGSRETDPDA